MRQIFSSLNCPTTIARPCSSTFSKAICKKNFTTVNSTSPPHSSPTPGPFSFFSASLPLPSPPLFPIFARQQRASERRDDEKRRDFDEPTAGNHDVNPDATTSGDSGVATVANFVAPVPRIASHNVASLSHYATAPEGRRRRGRVISALRDFIPKADIICLQETNLATGEASALSSLPGCTVSRNNGKMGASLEP